MSEQGWREFLAADGVDDWVVLHGGATAVFRVGSLAEAARLAEAVACIPGVDPGILMTVVSDRLTVRLTRDVWQLEPSHIELAQAVSALARKHGAVLLTTEKDLVRFPEIPRGDGRPALVAMRIEAVVHDAEPLLELIESALRGRAGDR